MKAKTQPELDRYEGEYITHDERWPAHVQPILVENGDDFPLAGYVRVEYANGVTYYDHAETIQARLDSGVWSRLIEPDGVTNVPGFGAITL
jgi:hypothetical protein